MSSRLKRELFLKSKKLKVPVSGTFELTRRCNLNCRMCYIHDQTIEKELSADRWISLGQQACDQGMLYLLLTGGEPFIRKDFSYIYKALIKLGLRISINTNGTMLSDEILETLKQYPPEQINITIYGSSSETYQRLCGNPAAYERVLKNLARLQKARLPVALNTTFTRLNIDDMSEIVAIAKAEHLPVRMASYIFPPAAKGKKGMGADTAEDFILSAKEMGEAIASFERLTLSEEELRRREAYIRHMNFLKSRQIEKQEAWNSGGDVITGSRCMAGCGAFWIGYDGQMYACGMLRDGESVLELGFERAWTSIKEKAGLYSYPQECLVCTKKKICPFCQAVYENLGKDMAKVKTCVCMQTDAYIRWHQG